MRKRMIIMVIFLVALFGSIFAWNKIRAHFMHEYFANFQPPPATVNAVQAKAMSWQSYIDVIGTLSAVNGVDISSEVSGTVVNIYFLSGEMIKKGDPIIKIDDSVEVAELKNAEASLQLAEINYKRYQDLYQKNAASASQRDEFRAKMLEAQAQKEKEIAIIAQKNITAPFSGKLGIRQVDLGQYLSPGNEIVTLQQLDPLYVDFYVPEQNLPNLFMGQAVEVAVDALAKEIFKGKIIAINSKSDTNTHNIQVRAQIDNPDLKLLPGLFVNVQVLLSVQKNAIVVPKTAVTFSSFGNSVFIISENGKDATGKPIYRAKNVFVKTGDSRGNQVVILSGVKAGDWVVTSGQLKLENNSQVIINNSVKI